MVKKPSHLAAGFIPESAQMLRSERSGVVSSGYTDRARKRQICREDIVPGRR